jgi:hypothetical protein
MKRLFWMSVFALGAAVLGGCPIYPDHGSTHRVCPYGDTRCYDCPEDYYSDSCVSWACTTNVDCPSGYSCQNGTCVSGSPIDGGNTCTRPGDCGVGQTCGSDGRCHTGDCSNYGCPGGYTCKLSGGSLSCVANTDGGQTGCQSDAACATSHGAGAKCLNGTCTKPEDQCSDATQCKNGQQCVAGVCTPSCSATKPCPTGYSCDANGVCTGNPTPCGSSGSCSSGRVCVEERCVDPCGAGSSCGTGLICVNGGCVPDEKPQFICGTEGKPGDGQPGNCASGSVCLRHSCYIACTQTDAGATGCENADKFNVCKSVTTGSGTYSVCGSSSNLGTECDPSRGLNCASGKVCIDGFCR